MHTVLYVCLPRVEARTSYEARRKVSHYLTAEAFDTPLRFSGRCDYFSVGGRYSGRLTLLRLRDEQPDVFRKMWKSVCSFDAIEEQSAALFRKAFPAYSGMLPINRGCDKRYGEPDDAQIMDKALFRQLKRGFSTSPDYSWEIDEPNVICTEDDDDFNWPRTIKEAAEFWVVVIDYHS